MISIGGGQLIIRPLSARISHNTEWFGKMDPYLEFEFEGQIKKSEVCQKGGTTPTWTDTICFQRARDFLLNIKLWDYERYKAHDLIASTEINVSEIMAQGFKDADVQLDYDGKVGAVVKMRFEYRRHEQQTRDGLVSMMDSKQGMRSVPQSPASMPVPVFNLSSNPYREIPPMMGFPQPKPQPLPYPVGNVRPQPNIVRVNPYLQEQNKSAMYPTSKQSLPLSSSSSLPSSNPPSSKQIIKEPSSKVYTAEEMDAMLN